MNFPQAQQLTQIPRLKFSQADGGDILGIPEAEIGCVSDDRPAEAVAAQ
jgi:hypothetical protein